ncbi:MAG: FAD/NAD(P)-binding protein [Bacteroidota bacterium]
MKNSYDLVIIGGGAAGLLLLANIFEQATSPISVALINAGYPLGRGIAYSTDNINHLLNVRVSRMSAFTNDVNHFTKWILSQPHYREYHHEGLEERFVPRKMYGEYLDDVYQNLLKSSNKYVQFEVMNEEAICLDKMGDDFKIELKNGNVICSKKVTLCTGNQPPISLPGLNAIKNSEKVYINPWLSEAVENIDLEQPIFIVGSGLTMVDTVISLIDQGFKNKIFVVSKHGAIPMAHPIVRVSVPHPDNAPPADLHKIYSQLKSRIRSAIDHTEWHEPVLEAVRPFTQKIWQELSIEHKNRFLRHINHRWAKLRHRLPHEVHSLIQSLVDEGQIELYAGKLIDVKENQNGLTIQFFDKEKESNVQLNAQRIINCIGPEGDYGKVENPLLKHMLNQGLISKDPLSLGFNATGDGNIIDQEGQEVANLFTIGSGLRGILWESTAIPEIRVQAHQMATKLLSSPQFI